MTIQYKADKVTAPSTRGIERTNGKASTVGGKGALTALNVTAANQVTTLDASLLGQWITLQANGCTVWFVGAAAADTPVATATGGGRKVSDGELVNFILTQDTQQLAYISTGAFTGGLLYWASARDS